VPFFQFQDVTGTGVSLEYITETPLGPLQDPHQDWCVKKWSFFTAPALAGIAKFDKFYQKNQVFGQFINFLAIFNDLAKSFQRFG
jgi:hypothetical protein